jgi:predicted transcriptional regulator
MGVTKTDLFNSTQNELAAYAKVLAHPARIAIIQFLLKSDTCCNTTLVGDLGLAQATISQHLKELKNVGIIQGTVEGVSVNYCINPEKWNEIKEKFTELFEGFNPPDCSIC